ncbi:hypothetical protein [Streptomyces longisporoflavus]|uniref:Integral membrane protein n=2 Tax=Streptomyces longisporoflavus TaxID=28044 RepID=A0ABW7QP40_9ACTN|nr:hypothetical protein GCM10010277_31990 [Streptomyces longisporoflavus]
MVLEWRYIAKGVRVVPEPVATPFLWTAACAGTFALVTVLDLVGALDRTGFALAALSVLAALLGVRGRFAAAPGTALLCWMLLNYFAVHPVGEISWAGHRDPEWMACLLGAALIGTTTGRVLYARAAYRRISPYDGTG